MNDLCMPATITGDLKKKVGEVVTKTIQSINDGKGDSIFFSKNSCGAGIVKVDTVINPDTTMTKTVEISATKPGSFVIAYKNTACDAPYMASSSCTISS